MSSDQTVGIVPSKWLVVSLAVGLSAVSIALILWLIGGGVFRQGFGDLRYIYYGGVCTVIFITICFFQTRYPHSKVASIVWPMVAAYLASVISYFILSARSLEKMVQAHHAEILLLVFALPYHLIFVVSALIATLLMQGFLAIYVFANRGLS
jgi:hypothetical protein